MSSKKADMKDDFPLSREDGTQQPAKSSLISGSEEVSFPRGGASALTPLELKQVANEAASDVLFGNNKKRENSSSTASRNKKSKKTKGAESNEMEVVGDDEDEDFKVIQHVNFKNLKVGSLLLGQISSITRNDLCVSFTDGINGYVPITNVSEQITNILAEIDQEMAESSDDSDSDEEYDSDEEKTQKPAPKQQPNLNELFKIGQWLRCSVTENTALDSSNKKKRRLELSIEPSVVNVFSKDDLNKFATVQCSVKSIEDHGAILDLGIENMSGFISKKDYKNIEDLKPGHVFLANIAKRSDRTVTVNQIFTRKNKVSHISSVDSVIPGQLVDFLCEKIGTSGIFGKAFGSVVSYISDIHLNTFSEEQVKEKFPVGKNIQTRIIGSIINGEGDKVLLLSTQEHIISLDSKLGEIQNLEAFPVGYTFTNASIKGRDSTYLYLSLDDERIGQVHNNNIGSALESDKILARVIGFSSIDNCFQLTTDPTILEKKYIRAIDIKSGEIITGCEVIAVSTEGIQIKIFGGQFTAFVPPLHIADTRLVYPERKFKIGSKVKGRVLSVNSKGHIFVTLKKSLVNADFEETNLVKSFDDASTVKSSDSKTVATVQQFRPAGAIISFFGTVRGFIPNAEISEAFVRRPEEHLRLGQTVIVKILEVSEERSRIIASCKVSANKFAEQKQAVDSLILGRSIIEVEVVEKTKDSILVETSNTSLRGIINVGHLSDSRIEQNRAEFKKIRLGSKLRGLVIDKNPKTQIFTMTLKQSLINDAEKETLPVNYQDVVSKDKKTPLKGYIKSISNKGIFVAFNGKFVGLVLPNYAVESKSIDINKIYYVNQSVTAYLLRSDDENERFLLTLREQEVQKPKTTTSSELINPIDNSVNAFSDFTIGKIVKAKITAVNKNQLNVSLAENLFGRVHVSEVFDNFKAIKDPKHPLSEFKTDDIISVKVIGLHNFINHQFESSFDEVKPKSILELTHKPSQLKSSKYSLLSAKDLKVGQQIIGFINNFKNDTIWVSINPSLHAKLPISDLSVDSDDISDKFPLGSAMKVYINSINVSNNSLMVTNNLPSSGSYDDIVVNSTVRAKILKVTDRIVILSLGNNITGISFITDALNDYSVSLKEAYKDKINESVDATVLSVDAENKKIKLSLRSKEAKTLSTSNDVKPSDIVHAIIKNITDKGIYVYLGNNLDAFVPVSKLSDSYLKDWKVFFKPMQPVVGKVVSCSNDSRILLTLKESEVNGEIQVLKNYNDIKVGDIFNGNVKNVTDFGVFVKLDNTLNVSGLAHRTEVAETVPEDLSTLFGVGDKVKAFVLKVNPEKKQLSLSLKASHFSNLEEKDAAEESEDEVMVDVDYNNQSDDVSETEEVVSQKSTKVSMSTNGLSLSSGFDWTANILDQAQSDEESDDDDDFTEPKRTKHKKKRTQITEDKTIDINTRAPESVSDFERLIMGNPNSSVVWMNYLAFQLQLSEIERAREIAERALKTINFREESEKLNIWIAMLNLENTFGSEETLEDIFKRACQYMDSFTIHLKLLSILQMSEKFDKAAELFKATAKKFGSNKVSIWVLWGKFLISQHQTKEARTILSNALKSLPKRNHVEVVRKFAQLEYSKGDAERGRSLFEGLLADASKRIDIWNVYIDQEIKANEKKKVEDLFERVIQKKITRKQAKFFFNKWLQFEETQKDEKAIGYVKAKATEYAENHPRTTEEEQ